MFSCCLIFMCWGQADTKLVLGRMKKRRKMREKGKKKTYITGSKLSPKVQPASLALLLAFIFPTTSLKVI